MLYINLCWNKKDASRASLETEEILWPRLVMKAAVDESLEQLVKALNIL